MKVLFAIAVVLVVICIGLIIAEVIQRELKKMKNPPGPEKWTPTTHGGSDAWVIDLEKRGEKPINFAQSETGEDWESEWIAAKLRCETLNQ